MNEVKSQIKATMDAVCELGMQTVIIYPNLDAGGKEIITEIEKNRSRDFIQIHKNLPRKDYLSLLNIASVLVGNSSSGIIEAASFKLPVVNIGTRQLGRECASNVIDVAHSKRDIIKAVERALSEQFKKSISTIVNPFFGGNTGQKVARVLAEIDINKKLIQKRMTY